MDTQRICAALGDALNSSPRPPALAALARVKYPMRELRPMMEADETMSISIALYGWEYKHRGPRPPAPPPVNVGAVCDALSGAMPQGVKICSVENYGTNIKLIIKKENNSCWV